MERPIKTYALTLLIVLPIACSYGQTWQSTSGGIYYNGGNVGIGNNNPDGLFHVNTVRPVVIKNNGGSGVYGSEIGFNAVLNTSVLPNQFRKLGGTEQEGGAAMVVDYHGNMYFQMYNAQTKNESITAYAPQVKFSSNGNVNIAGAVEPNSFLMHSEDDQTVFYIHRPATSSDPFRIALGAQSIEGGIMIGREDWISKVMIPWDVGIGTQNPDAKLTVKGDIHAEEVRVDLNIPGPDYVFEEDYNLPSLSSIQNHIRKYKHLPGVPPAREMEEKGIEVGKMNMLLLEKVEELTLYILQQEQKIIQLRAEQHSREADLEVKINTLMLQQEKLLEKLEDQGRRINELDGN